MLKCSPIRLPLHDLLAEVLTNAAKMGWRAAAWMLSHCWPTEYSGQQRHSNHTGPGMCSGKRSKRRSTDVLVNAVQMSVGVLGTDTLQRISKPLFHDRHGSLVAVLLP
jgi:hypothetical protein